MQNEREIKERSFVCSIQPKALKARWRERERESEKGMKRREENKTDYSAIIT